MTAAMVSGYVPVEPPPGKSGAKVAVTDVAAFMVTVQVVAVPEHAPDQPTNRVPTDPTLAFSVTTDPLVTSVVMTSW